MSLLSSLTSVVGLHSPARTSPTPRISMEIAKTAAP